MRKKRLQNGESELACRMIIFVRGVVSEVLPRTLLGGGTSPSRIRQT